MATGVDAKSTAVAFSEDEMSHVFASRSGTIAHCNSGEHNNVTLQGDNARFVPPKG
jgi:hypothetical protein